VIELVKQILKNFTYVHKETMYQSFYILKNIDCLSKLFLRIMRFILKYFTDYL